MIQKYRYRLRTKIGIRLNRICNAFSAFPKIGEVLRIHSEGSVKEFFVTEVLFVTYIPEVTVQSMELH